MIGMIFWLIFWAWLALVAVVFITACLAPVFLWFEMTPEERKREREGPPKKGGLTK